MPSFNTLLHNSNVIFSRRWNICSLHNKTVSHLAALNCILMFAVATASGTVFIGFYLYLHDSCHCCCWWWRWL